jgi:hypothetical protein
MPYSQPKNCASMTNPLPSYHRVQVSIQTGTPSPHNAGLALVWCLDLLPKFSTITVGPERARTHDKRGTSLPAPISKYVLRIISLWLDQGPMQWTVLNRHRRDKCNQSPALLPNQIQVHPSSVPLGLQLLFICNPCDSNLIIVTIIYFLSLASDR